ncbi:uncharacterized protein LOC136083790 isoform X2 [Hydra vulgaris]|uniref:Uncharacterized protein LOC136083790 isoform X2 n=1 Tax=Hydra vulgaris TaxID=6087 RepID=A0ABM4CD89_HYDVU
MIKFCSEDTKKWTHTIVIKKKDCGLTVEWKIYLTSMYGNSICLLDATYKTTRYAIPLFFLVVKTNVDYQVVASFAIQNETVTLITEALTFIKIWNPLWLPQAFMVDNCDEEIQSILFLFPNTHLLLCDFLREQAWVRWLSAYNNGLRDKRETILVMLRKVASSETHDLYEEHVRELKASELWKSDSSKNFRN